jgi:hypothetical protein
MKYIVTFFLCVITALSQWQPTETTNIFSVLEVLGQPGTEAVTVCQVPGDCKTKPRLQIKLTKQTYNGKASISVNGGSFIPLRNDNVVFIDEASQYIGKFGGALDVHTILLPFVELQEGNNIIRFKFNANTNGLTDNSIGYRVLDVAAVAPDGTRLSLLTKPHINSDNFTTNNTLITTGSNLWNTALLVNRWGGTNISAKCANCHMKQGLDLKLWGFSNWTIRQRSIFHGLTDLDGQAVAAFIQSAPILRYAFPFDPPFQPGPSLDSTNQTRWVAGAGLNWILPSDTNMWAWYLGTNLTPPSSWTNILNHRTTPVAFPYLDILSWWPTHYHTDAFGLLASNVLTKVESAYNDDPTNAPGSVAFKLREAVGEISNMLPHVPPTYKQTAGWRSLWQWLSIRSLEIHLRGGMFDRWHLYRDTIVASYTNSNNTVVIGRGMDADGGWFISAPHFTVEPTEGNYFRDGTGVTWGNTSMLTYAAQLAMSGNLRIRNGQSPIDWQYQGPFAEIINYPNEAYVNFLLWKNGQATSAYPINQTDGFIWKQVKLELTYNSERPTRWLGYSSDFRDSMLRAWVNEYDRTVRAIGRDAFIARGDISAALNQNNSPGAPFAEPWINNHASSIVYYKSKSVASDIVAKLVALGEFLWPSVITPWNTL